MNSADFTEHPLPYVNHLPQRSTSQIDLLVIHCTELPDLATARQYGERVLYPESGTGNSGHFYIDRDGAIECWVEPSRVAHHVRGFNERSIGIELVNSGRYPDWLHSKAQSMDEPYTEMQMTGLAGLLTWLVSTCPSITMVAGHEDLDREAVPASDNPDLLVRRKRDPGPLFPWQDLLATCTLKRFPPG